MLTYIPTIGVYIYKDSMCGYCISYSTVVLYIGIMKVRGFWPEIITPKQAWYLLSDTLGVLVRLSQAQKCLQIIPLNSYEILDFSYLTHFSTDWLTYLLAIMPSEKHNLRTAGPRDLISSLINISSSWNVSFHQLQLLQYLHQGATFVPLWSSIVFFLW